MSGMPSLMNAFSAASALWLGLLTFRTLRFHRTLGYLRDVKIAVKSAAPNWPKLSLIIPACNEEGTIAAATTSLLKVDYPHLELVLVNDRSTDRTGEIICALAANDPRIIPVEIKDLPNGWLGKLNALNTGTQAATGEWFLFTDADVHFKTTSLKKAISYCEHAKVDFLSVTPTLISHTFALKVAIAQFVHFGSLLFNLKGIRDPKASDVIGVGAFNLVRKTNYQASEGFTGIKMDVLDDTGLALILKRAGARMDFLSGKDEIEIEWYQNLPTMVRGLEKNGFAIFQYSFAAVLAFNLGAWLVFLFSFTPLFLSAAGGIKILYLVALASYLIGSGIALHIAVGFSPFMALTLPVSFVLFPLIYLRSAMTCMRDNAVVWRGTSYPLATMRAQQKLRLTDILFSKKMSPQNRA